MAEICPTVTAYDTHEFRRQMELVSSFAHRIHIDLMDGQFTPNKSPSLNQVWWPDNIIADIHLMYGSPMKQLDTLVKLKPHLVVIHAEADVNHEHFAIHLRENGIKAGLAIMQKTSVDHVEKTLPMFDHVMVYSGNLGEHGGQADLNLLDKVRQLNTNFSEMEISWDGGINDQNAVRLVEAGVKVLNVGGFIHSARDPADAYAKLKNIIGG